MKKVLLIIGLAVSVYFAEEVLYFLTGSGLIANWGSIIIPSFAAGILLNLLIDGTERNRFAIWLAASVLVSKLITIFMSVFPTLLAIILMIIFYFFTSYLFIFLGRKITEGGRRENTPT